MHATVFVQPSPASIAWNQIGDASPSAILGSLSANGTLVLVNPSGFYFGPDAHVAAAGLVATNDGTDITIASSNGTKFRIATVGNTNVFGFNAASATEVQKPSGVRPSASISE